MGIDRVPDSLLSARLFASGDLAVSAPESSNASLSGASSSVDLSQQDGLSSALSVPDLLNVNQEWAELGEGNGGNMQQVVNDSVLGGLSTLPVSSAEPSSSCRADLDASGQL